MSLHTVPILHLLSLLHTPIIISVHSSVETVPLPVGTPARLKSIPPATLAEICSVHLLRMSLHSHAATDLWRQSCKEGESKMRILWMMTRPASVSQPLLSLLTVRAEGVEVHTTVGVTTRLLSLKSGFVGIVLEGHTTSIQGDTTDRQHTMTRCRNQPSRHLFSAHAYTQCQQTLRLSSRSWLHKTPQRLWKGVNTAEGQCRQGVVSQRRCRETVLTVRMREFKTTHNKHLCSHVQPLLLQQTMVH